MESKIEFLRAEGTNFPGKTYVESLLKPVFYDQKKYLFSAMFQVHRAHVVMLTEQGILPKEQVSIILKAVEKVAQTPLDSIQYNPDYEDLFFVIEAKIAEEIGDDLAGNMHVARSRNDMGVTMYRLVLREKLLILLRELISLQEVCLELAHEHIRSVMPAYTHTQPAQPTTLGHYLTAVHDMLSRDLTRLWSAYQLVNQSPMGAAAITTTSFPIRRQMVCHALGFEQVVENSYDAVAGADYLMEVATAIIICMTNMGRWIQDFLLYCTAEFGVIRVADPYVQISSIMPQKRNPVSVEHSRSLASSAVGDAQAVLTMIHNTPFGDIVDTEDDLQPHLYSSIEKALRVIRLMTAVLRTMEINTDHLRNRASQGAITITELADFLYREKGISFRTAHTVAAMVSRYATQHKKELANLDLAWILQMMKEVVQQEIVFTQEEWGQICNPEYFVNVRACQGGTNPDEILRMIHERKKELACKWSVYEMRINKLQSAEKELRDRVSSFLQDMKL